MPIRILSLALLFLAGIAPAQTALSDYLPEGVEYDASVPEPRDVLGWGVGEWHVRHDKLVEYMKALAAASDRVRIEVIGHSHERRELLMLTITSPARFETLDRDRARHLELCAGGDAKIDVSGMPVVVNLGYSVHGNESSGANAAMLVVYHLAAAKGKAITELLENAIILVDPCLNPDGLARFAQWANMHKGKNLIGDPRHREHREGWPSGRTNHYWFDLNRDWLLLEHPESRARVKKFHQWRPNVLADFHEMGSNGTYFFQPGVPERKNPMTPQENVDLTTAIAKFHAKALDARGQLYFTKEMFDDFYYGKGSTYPDVHGGVGILFEQGSSRGHVQETRNGTLTFPTTIANQLATSLSTLEGALAHRVELLEYQREFYRTAKFEAAADPVKMYAIPYEDVARPYEAFLAMHGIDFELCTRSRPVERAGSGKRQAGEPEELREDPDVFVCIRADQPQYRLIKSLFERRTSFASDEFYDVSTWRLPSAYGLECIEVGEGSLGREWSGVQVLESAPTRQLGAAESTIAWRFKGERATRMVADLAARNVLIRFLPDPPAGDFIIHPHGQTLGRAELRQAVAETSRRHDVEVSGIPSPIDGPFFSELRVDLGSPQVRPISMPKPLIVVGPGVSAYEAGEAWFVLDERYGIPVSLIEMKDLGAIDLENYSHVIMVNGTYSSISEKTEDELKRWVRRGGVVFAQKSAGNWAARRLLGKKVEPSKKSDVPEEQERRFYADRKGVRARRGIPGTVFTARIDRSHPLGWGFPRDELHMFKNSTATMLPTDDKYANVVVYDAEPHLCGYAPEEAVKKIAGTPAVIAERMGSGVVVRVADDVCFRAYWRGTERLLVNTLFFAGMIERTAGADEEEAGHEDHGHAKAK